MTNIQTEHDYMPNDLVDDPVSTNNTETHNEYYTQDNNVVDESKSYSDEVSNNVGDDNAQEPENTASVERITPEDISSPGAHLRDVREKNKMSIKHVADKLFLDTRVIKSLEADEYNDLPPTIFVRGYLRNYAKLLEVPSKPVLEIFARNTTDQPEQKLSYLSPQSKRNRETSSQDLWPTIGTFIVIITLIILAVLWQVYPTTPVGSQTPVNNNERTNDSSWPSALYEPIVEPNTTLSPTVANSNKPETFETTPGATPPNTATKPSPNSGIASLPPGQQTMQVHFKNKVWMRIFDAKSQKLYDGISKAGKVVSLTGFPPFRASVGNTGVEIEYAGNTKNIKHYPKYKGRSRSFIIGTKEDG